VILFRGRVLKHHPIIRRNLFALEDSRILRTSSITNNWPFHFFTQLRRKNSMSQTKTRKLGKALYLVALFAAVSGLSILFSNWIHQGKIRQSVSSRTAQPVPASDGHQLESSQSYQSTLIHPFENPIKKSTLSLDSLPSYPEVTLVGNYARRDNRVCAETRRACAKSTYIDVHYFFGGPA